MLSSNTQSMTECIPLRRGILLGEAFVNGIVGISTASRGELLLKNTRISRMTPNPHDIGRELDIDATDLPTNDLRVFEQALHGKNADKLRALFKGELDSPALSDCDATTLEQYQFTLLEELFFWCKGNRKKAERLFGLSELADDQWKHDEEYRKDLLDRVKRKNNNVYEGELG